MKSLAKTKLHTSPPTVFILSSNKFRAIYRVGKAKCTFCLHHNWWSSLLASQVRMSTVSTASYKWAKWNVDCTLEKDTIINTNARDNSDLKLDLHPMISGRHTNRTYNLGCYELVLLSLLECRKVKMGYFV